VGGEFHRSFVVAAGDADEGFGIRTGFRFACGFDQLFRFRGGEEFVG
jgi:hypothetical protein